MVLVEIDTMHNEDEIMTHRKDIKRYFRTRRGQNKSVDTVRLGIRRARYRELWKYLRFLMVDKIGSEGSDSGAEKPSKWPWGSGGSVEVGVGGDEGETDLLLGGGEHEVEIIDDKKKKKKFKRQQEGRDSPNVKRRIPNWLSIDS